LSEEPVFGSRAGAVTVAVIAGGSSEL